MICFINKSIGKIESLESLQKLEEIANASDGIMVASGDQGVEVPLEQIPAVQEEITNVCRQLNKPVIIASQLLESMVEYPTPTHAEGVFGLPVSGHGVSWNVRQVKSGAIRHGVVRAVAEVSTKKKSKSLDLLGLDVVAEGELREKGFLGMRKTKLKVQFGCLPQKKFEGSLPFTVQANYEGFSEGIIVGDELVIDGGMASFEVIEKIGHDLRCKCTDPGLLLPGAKIELLERRVLVERNYGLPTLSVKINKVLAKIESLDSLQKLEEIAEASDGIMVARGDLGVEIPLEQIPTVQEEITHICSRLNKPVIIASQLLESMVEYPTHVLRCFEAVRQYADALMLSGESAIGSYGQKALSVLQMVSSNGTMES
ncbi:hypothetical protein GH714_009114 [Hevea brasiliensis]|uniref:Pyruvate kinase n=1 Tax=Hevea brasiliensis TaxID=3981 RepID=A0A6A6L0M8_HEVBR|nr:hypothetical protein GH714_009114 [Hevea brasiliensis]